MKRYWIKITLENGNEVHAKSVGNDENDAIGRVLSSEQFTKFSKGEKIEKTFIVEIEKDETINPDDYTVQDGRKEDEYIAVDKKNLIMVTFMKGRYNETAKVDDLNAKENTDASEVATILRRIGEYLGEHHSDLL